MADFTTRVRYLAWAGRRVWIADHQCPWCGGSSSLVRRKFLVTALRCCRECGLRFRTPKDDIDGSRAYYEHEYRQGFTTDCPTNTALSQLVIRGFKGTEKDYSRYLDVLAAFGLLPGATILDFGCSWGYGSWQLERAGYRTISYDLSRLRARYASEKLGCAVVDDPLALSEGVDCVFSAHVLEHMGAPRQFWEVVEKVLRPGGWVVCFVPNGDRMLEHTYGSKRFHQMWGQSHALMLDAASLERMAADTGLRPSLYSAPYNVGRLAAGESDSSFGGEELLLLGRRPEPVVDSRVAK